MTLNPSAETRPFLHDFLFRLVSSSWLLYMVEKIKADNDLSQNLRVFVMWLQNKAKVFITFTMCKTDNCIKVSSAEIRNLFANFFFSMKLATVSTHIAKFKSVSKLTQLQSSNPSFCYLASLISQHVFKWPPILRRSATRSFQFDFKTRSAL